MILLCCSTASYSFDPCLLLRLHFLPSLQCELVHLWLDILLSDARWSFPGHQFLAAQVSVPCCSSLSPFARSLLPVALLGGSPGNVQKFPNLPISPLASADPLGKSLSSTIVWSPGQAEHRIVFCLVGIGEEHGFQRCSQMTVRM